MADVLALPFALTDLEIVILFGVVLVVVYVLGTFWKHKALKKYARLFQDRFSSRAKVGFASFGHAGLRIKCQMNDKSEGFREMHFALTLGARENLMYYPLVRLTHDFDRLRCWGLLDKPVPTDVKVIRAKDKRRIESYEDSANLRRLNVDALHDSGFVVYASNKDSAEFLLMKTPLAARLKEAKNLELLELDKDSSMLHVITRLKKEALTEIVNFILSVGRSV